MTTLRLSDELTVECEISGAPVLIDRRDAGIV